MKPEDITPENIQRLAMKHLERYRVMLAAHESGEPGFRARELRDLLAIWGSIQAKQCEWGRLSDAERGEVYDAIESGE